MTNPIIAIDQFAGIGGWDFAARNIGGIRTLGIDNMPEVVATRELNGFETVGTDVYEWFAQPSPAPYDMLLASPPCQTFSMTGNGSGRAALDTVLALVKARVFKDVNALHRFGDSHDPRTALVLMPLTTIARDLPRFIALEQVPTVLPVWEAYAEYLTELGYSVVTGLLNAEEYGAPQTRKRAVLIARSDGRPARMPQPTHSKYWVTDPDRLNPLLEKWVSMEEALGMPADAEVQSNYGTRGDSTNRGVRLGSQPAATVTSKLSRSRVFVSNNRFAHSARRDSTHPAPTITGGHDSGNRVWVTEEGETRITTQEAAILQGFPADLKLGGKPYKQNEMVGNAIPVQLAEAILRELLA